MNWPLMLLAKQGKNRRTSLIVSNRGKLHNLRQWILKKGFHCDKNEDLLDSHINSTNSSRASIYIVIFDCVCRFERCNFPSKSVKFSLATSLKAMQTRKINNNYQKSNIGATVYFRTQIVITGEFGNVYRPNCLSNTLMEYSHTRTHTHTNTQNANEKRHDCQIPIVCVIPLSNTETMQQE